MALLTKIRTKLGIHARRKVFGLLDGGYASVHTGRSMDFNDLREYVPGDDIKDVDWKASARNRQLLVKRYVAERKHTILLVVSTGRTMAAAASPDDSKADLAVLGAGMVGYLALRHADYVGLVAGHSGHRQSERPSTREINLERMLHVILDQCRPEAPAADLLGLLDHVVRTVSRRTIMLVVCEDIELDDELIARLKRLRAQHELLVLTIGDLDVADAALGDRAVTNIDSGAAVPWFVRRDAQLSDELAQLARDRQAQRRNRLDQLGIASAQINTADDAVSAVLTLLERHRHAA